MKKSYLKYFAALLLFGSNGVVASTISLSSYEIVLLRSVIGGALLLVLFFAAGNRMTVRRHKKDLLFIVLSGIAMAADWLFLFEAYAQIGVSLGMLINYCGPALVIAFSPVLFRECITGSKIIALSAAVTGAFLISGQAAVSGLSIWGLFCAAMSAVSYAVMVLSNKMAKEVGGTENATLQLLATAVTVMIFVGWKQGAAIEIAPGDWMPVLWLGLINTGMGCFFYFSSIGQLPAQSVAVCGYLEPLSAVLLSVLVLHEKMTGWQMLGAALIIGGALYGELGKRKSWNLTKRGIRTD